MRYALALCEQRRSVTTTAVGAVVGSPGKHFGVLWRRARRLDVVITGALDASIDDAQCLARAIREFPKHGGGIHVWISSRGGSIAVENTVGKALADSDDTHAHAVGAVHSAASGLFLCCRERTMPLLSELLLHGSGHANQTTRDDFGSALSVRQHRVTGLPLGWLTDLNSGPDRIFKCIEARDLGLATQIEKKGGRLPLGQYDVKLPKPGDDMWHPNNGTDPHRIVHRAERDALIKPDQPLPLTRNDTPVDDSMMPPSTCMYPIDADELRRFRIHALRVNRPPSEDFLMARRVERAATEMANRYVGKRRAV